MCARFNGVRWVSVDIASHCAQEVCSAADTPIIRIAVAEGTSMLANLCMPIPILVC